MSGTAYSNKKSSSPSPLGRGQGGGAHILAIRLSAMGDVAMMVPVLLALKKQYPKVKITILTKPHFEPIFDSMEGVSVIPAEVNSRHKGILGLWKLYRELGVFSFSHIADLHNSIRSGILGVFFGLKHIPLQKIDKGRAEKRALIQQKYKQFRQLKLTIERYADVFRDLGFEFDVGKAKLLSKKKLPPQLQSIVGTGYNKIIGIAPFATYQSKMYRLDLLELVIQKLTKHTNCLILLFGGGKREEEQLKILESKFSNCVQSVVGKFNFKQELAIISNLDAMLAMDSGNGHLAANYGVPVVTVWGVTHPYVGFVPYNQPLENSLVPDRDNFPLVPTSVYGNKFPEGYLEAINSISPDRIVEKVLNVLQQD